MSKLLEGPGNNVPLDGSDKFRKGDLVTLIHDPERGKCEVAGLKAFRGSVKYLLTRELNSGLNSWFPEDQLVSAKNEGANIIGQLIPVSVKGRKDKLDELIRVHEDINHGHVLSYVSSLSEEEGEAFGEKLDQGCYDEAADMVREHSVRMLVRKMLPEIVRKKPGGGYVVYKPKDPQRDKGKPPQKAGEVGNLANAYEKLATLTKDPKQRERLIKRANRARKHPESFKTRTSFHVQGQKKPVPKKEGIDLLKAVVSHLVQERLFREEATGSGWDEHLSKFSSKALEGDSKFKNLQKKIDKVTETVLVDAFNAIKKAVGKTAKLQDKGVKKHEDLGQTILTFSAQIGDVNIEPIFIYVEHGVPAIELSQEAEAGLSNADPDDADMFRGKLGTVQEKTLSKVKDLLTVIEARDKYLSKVQDDLDKYVSGLSPLQVSLLKVLLVKKYRKI